MAGCFPFATTELESIPGTLNPFFTCLSGSTATGTLEPEPVWRSPGGLSSGMAAEFGLSPNLGPAPLSSLRCLASRVLTDSYIQADLLNIGAGCVQREGR